MTISNQACMTRDSCYHTERDSMFGVFCLVHHVVIRSNAIKDCEAYPELYEYQGQMSKLVFAPYIIITDSCFMFLMFHEFYLFNMYS